MSDISDIHVVHGLYTGISKKNLKLLPRILGGKKKDKAKLPTFL